MLLSKITSIIENVAPLQLQESYDNAGLIIGNAKMEINKALICFDVTEEVLDEAISIGANLIISHHPIIFGGIKKLNGKNYVERIVLKAIKNDIALYIYMQIIINRNHLIFRITSWCRMIYSE